MATEQQEHRKIEQLREASADEIEVIAGREREDLQGWIPPLATEAEVKEALEKAFDYRGDVTLTLRTGEVVEGYIYDRRHGAGLDDSMSGFSLPPPTARAEASPTRRLLRWSSPAAILPRARASKPGSRSTGRRKPPARRTSGSSRSGWTEPSAGRMKVFLTGATGFVGSHVARVYAAAGAELRLLTRITSNPAALEGLPGDRVLGDLCAPEPLRSAVEGCEALVHVAADYRLWVPDPAQMYRANVEGTRDLLRIARECGVQRVIYTSSVATMGFQSDGTIVDEETPVSEANMIGHYKRSKFLAEQEAMRAAQAGQHIMILNPTTPIGAGDRKPTPTGRIIVDFLNRKFPAYVDTGLNLVDVEEVARMHVAALDHGTPGERYILGGENLTLKQILDRMSAISGLPSPTHKVPHSVAMAFAFLDETITGKLRGKEPRATVEAVRMGRKFMFASSAKAERELGFEVKPVYPALRSAMDWFTTHGYAPPFRVAA